MKRLYLAWGSMVLALLGGFTWFDWTLGSSEEVKGVPRSVRDNPGAWRTHYYGGK